MAHGIWHITQRTVHGTHMDTYKRQNTLIHVTKAHTHTHTIYAETQDTEKANTNTLQLISAFVHTAHVELRQHAVCLHTKKIHFVCCAAVPQCCCAAVLLCYWADMLCCCTAVPLCYCAVCAHLGLPLPHTHTEVARVRGVRNAPTPHMTREGANDRVHSVRKRANGRPFRVNTGGYHWQRARKAVKQGCVVVPRTEGCQ
jgi:hypothetical protein